LDEAEANSGICSIGVGLFLSLMDTTVVATMLTAISEDFSGYRDAPWIILAYSLTYVGKPQWVRPFPKTWSFD
jgi:MFS family permease